MLNFSFVTPRKAHPCAEPHLLTYPLPDLDIFCRVVGDDQLRGGRGGANFAILHRLSSSSLQHSRTTTVQMCET